jgi:hypothetical protein
MTKLLGVRVNCNVAKSGEILTLITAISLCQNVKMTAITDNNSHYKFIV